MLSAMASEAMLNANDLVRRGCIANIGSFIDIAGPPSAWHSSNKDRSAGPVRIANVRANSITAQPNECSVFNVVTDSAPAQRAH